MGNEDCRECRAGYVQAMSMDVAWRCPDHGVQRLGDWGAQAGARLAAAEARIEALEAVVELARYTDNAGLDALKEAIAALDKQAMQGGEG